MRVIAGKYKGRKLIPPVGYDIRPTTDFTKETLFNILRDRIEGSRFLDLFGGSGALAIEALSQGAASVVVSDKDATSVNLIRRNLQALGASCEVYRGDYADVARKLTGRKFDIVMLDPPYAMEIAPVLKIVRECGLLAQGGVVVYEHDSHVVTPEVEGWINEQDRRYGRVTLTFLGGEA
ncbi:MAG: 16S rRNA (guanine(966)-N(2))-methyltransferase RsmD [Clostridia bacterium]|nr:16S rRNA (guanine(966)-N(2))-methyltransferase RsmD [Clostridia bacterium]